MELGPIPDIRAFTNSRDLPADFQLTAVLDINGVARSGNQGRSGQQKKAPEKAPAKQEADADADELTLSGESQPAPGESQSQSQSQSSGSIAEQGTETPEHNINLFA